MRIPTRYIGIPGEGVLSTKLGVEQIRRAHEEAEQGIQAARIRLAHHARRVRRRARATGFAAGRRAGAHEIDRLLEQSGRYYDAVIHAERDCLDLSVAIAAEIVATDLVPDHRILARRIDRAIRDLLDTKAVRVGVHTDDLESIRAAWTPHEGEPELSFFAEPSIDSGDAILETPAGSVRLIWREHLARIRERLLAGVSHPPNERGS